MTDFGLATVHAANETMTAVGTPAWAAPEVLRHERYSTKADVYGYAIVIWELLNEKPPWHKMSPLRVAHAVAYEVIQKSEICLLLVTTLPPPPSFFKRSHTRATCSYQNKRPPVAPGTSPELRSTLSQCWHQDAEQRPTFERLLEWSMRLDPSIFIIAASVPALMPAPAPGSTAATALGSINGDEDLRIGAAGGL